MKNQQISIIKVVLILCHIFCSDPICLQGYINRSNLPTGLGARRVSWEHVENMELRCALVLRAPCSVSQSTVLSVSEHRGLCLRALCSVSQSTVVCVSEHCAQCLRALCSVSQSTVLWFWRMYHSDETRFSETDN